MLDTEKVTKLQRIKNILYNRALGSVQVYIFTFFTGLLAGKRPSEAFLISSVRLSWPCNGYTRLYLVLPSFT